MLSRPPANVDVLAAIPGHSRATHPGSPILTLAASVVGFRSEETGRYRARQRPKLIGPAVHLSVIRVHRAPRTRCCFNTSRSGIIVLGHRRRTTTYSPAPASAARCRVSRRSTTPSWSQSETNGRRCGSVPRGGTWSSSCSRLLGTQGIPVPDFTAKAISPNLFLHS